MNDKVYKLESVIRAKVQEADELNKNDQMSDEQITRWDALKAEITKHEGELKRAKEQEEMNRKLAGVALRNEEDGEKKDIVRSFIKASREYIETNGRSISKDFSGSQGGLLIPNEILRANPILTTTNTSLVPVNVENSLSMVTGDNFTLLQALGVPFYTGLTGTHELPWMAQLSTSKPTEGGDASTADADPKNVELKPQTYSTAQDWTKMSLLNMPASIYSGTINDMQLANQRKVVVDYFSSIFDTDVSIAATVTGLTYGDMINLTKINYNIGSAKFVTDNDIRVYLEQKAVSSTGIALAWNALNNTIGSRQAISSDAMKAKRAVYGNHAFGAIGQWGSAELIVDGQTTPGKVKVTVLEFYKAVIRNKYAFKYFSADASCAV